MTNLDDNKALARRFNDFFDGGNLEGCMALLSPDMKGYATGAPGPMDRQAFRAMAEQFFMGAGDPGLSLNQSMFFGSDWSAAPGLTLSALYVRTTPSAFEYVLVHELCHLLRADHSRAFWREVEMRFPTWREERDYFHADGRRLKAALRGLLSG